MSDRDARTTGLRCPICGEGVLRDVSYDERAGPARQAADSDEVVTFTCGHEIRGRGLDEAARDDTNVERRTSEETVEPVDGDAA
jgi:hypothetical protein